MADIARAAAVSIQAEPTAPSTQVPFTPAPAPNAGTAVPETPAPKRATGVRDVAEETPSVGGSGHQFSQAQLGALAALLQGSGAGTGVVQEGKAIKEHLSAIKHVLMTSHQTQTSPIS
jgi:hypothetical protein